MRDVFSQPVSSGTVMNAEANGMDSAAVILLFKEGRMLI